MTTKEIEESLELIGKTRWPHGLSMEVVPVFESGEIVVKLTPLGGETQRWLARAKLGREGIAVLLSAADALMGQQNEVVRLATAGGRRKRAARMPRWLEETLSQVIAVCPVDPESRALAVELVRSLGFRDIPAAVVRPFNGMEVSLLWSSDADGRGYREAEVTTIGGVGVQVSVWSRGGAGRETAYVDMFPVNGPKKERAFRAARGCVAWSLGIDP